MKYKSELINEIVENEGHCSPSLHYESECIVDWLESIRGAYPKLCDYEGEWLDYYLENGGIGEFPYLALNNITSTTVENTVPIPFKSAIIKGNTLVNLCDKSKSVISAGGNKNLWENTLFNTNPTQLTIINHTDKVIKFTLHNRTTNKWISTNGVEANSKSLVNCGTDKYLKDLYGQYSDGWSNTEEDRNILKDGVLILEGDLTQEDIPYFEGMQSVKMPGLTTTGKNLFDSELEDGGLDSINGGNDDGQKDRIRTKSYIKVKPNTFYTLSRTIYENSWAVRYYDENYNHISPHSYNEYAKMEIKTKENVHYIRMVDLTNDLSNLYQLEEGKQVTAYEPHKSNILTVNGDLELHAIGDVKDELDCLTGQVTERIAEIVLDENITGYHDANYSVNGYSAFRVTLNANIPNGLRNAICDKLKYYPNINLDWTKQEEFFTLNVNYAFVKILSTKASNFEEFRTFLSSSPITIQYPLETESIKTVDLSIIDESGNSVSKLKAMNGITHIETNGTPLNPTFSGEIPVEAIKQNLYSFIEEE